MKKIFFAISFLLCAFFSFAQFPGSTSVSNSSTIYHIKGMIVGDVSTQIATVDTVGNPATPYAGALTRWGGLLYMTDGIHWHPFVSNGSGVVLDSIYVERPLAVKIGTSGAATGKQVIYFLRESGLISGGIPVSTGCRTLTMPPTIYIINYNQYTSLSTDLTIDTSDATLNRTDRIVGDTFGVISVIKGTASSLGLPPTYNPSSQFSLQLISIPAASTCIPSSNFSTPLYDQNLGVAGGEWDVTTTGTISADRNNTDNPLHLTKAIFVATYTDSSQIVLTHTGLQDTVTSSSVLVLPTYLNVRLTNPIQVQFFLNTTAVSNNTVINSFINPLDTGHYQLPVVPFGAFGFNSQIYNKVVITFRGQDISGAGGLYFDWIRIQKGINGFDFKLYVDSTKIISGNEYYYKGGIAYLAGAVGGGGSQTLQQVFDVETGEALLNKDDTINTNGQTLRVTGATPASSGSAIFRSTTTGVGSGSSILGETNDVGTGVSGSSATGWGVNGSSTSGVGVRGSSLFGTGLYGLSTTSIPIVAENISSVVNTVVSMFQINRTGSSTPGLAGIGSSIDFNTRTSAGSNQLANQIISKWTTATVGSRTSEVSITGVNSATTNELLTLSGNGGAKLTQYTPASIFYKNDSTTYKPVTIDATGNLFRGNWTGSGSSFTRQVHSSGATVTVTGGNYILTIDPASTLAAVTVTMPASPSDLQTVEIGFGGTLTSGIVVTALTVSPNSGQTIQDNTPPASGTADDTIYYRYYTAKTVWQRIKL